jgi:hypothetical protein
MLIGLRGDKGRFTGNSDKSGSADILIVTNVFPGRAGHPAERDTPHRIQRIR